MPIRQVPLSGKDPNAVAYVLEIGQATLGAPHQAFDHRYYKRFNFESTPMEDYEVRGLMRRSIECGQNRLIDEVSDGPNGRQGIGRILELELAAL